MFRHQKYPYQNILEDIRKKNPSQPNLYDILNGKVTPRIDTAFKLIRGLGYKYDIKLQSA